MGSKLGVCKLTFNPVSSTAIRRLKVAATSITIKGVIQNT